MAEVRFSLHAQRQMRRRVISAEEVSEAIDDRETTYASAQHPERLVVLGRTKRARRLKVVLVEDDPPFVVTVAGRDEEG